MNAGARNGDCQICGESSPSFHYGVRCCNCKCFFRRCVIQQAVYQCRAGEKQCEIRRESRNSCRACRYAMCIAVGLNPKLIHSGSAAAVVELPEQPGLSTPEGCVSQQFSSPSNSFTLPSVMADQLQPEINTSFPLGAVSGLLRRDYPLTNSLGRYFLMVERLCESYRDTPFNCASPHITYDLNVSVERAFLQPRSLIPRTAIDWEARYPITPESSYLLPRQWCREVAFYSDWASHIPELHQLDLEDQVRMLAGRVKQCSWLCVALRSIRFGAGKLVFFGDGGCYPLDPVEQAQLTPQINNFYQPLCNRMHAEIIRPALDIQVREEELALLKVLCFCTPVAGLKSPSLAVIKSAQAKYQAALVEEVMKRGAGQGMLGDIGRLMKMMGWLVAIECVAEKANKHLSLMTLFNIAEMNGTLPYELHVRSG